MYLLCLEIVLTEEGLTKKGKITGKVKGPEKISYNCNDAMLCASCKFCLVSLDNSVDDKLRRFSTSFVENSRENGRFNFEYGMM